MSRCNSRCCCRNYTNNTCPRKTHCSNNYSTICQNTSTPFPENYLYGHAYTPVQTLNNTFTPEVGLENGTIFPELVSPYYPGQSIEFINYLKNGGMQNEQ